MSDHDRLTDAHFQQNSCLNCGSAALRDYCPVCGQKRAHRLGAGEVRSEAWGQVRRFEFSFLRAALKTCLRPGRVAREFVMGARTRNIHPFKLYLGVIVFLLLLLNRINYLATEDAHLARAYELVQSWSKWSFSLGILAMFVTTRLIFLRRGGFNWVEHLVLATYAHSVVLIVAMLNMAPLLVIGDPDTIRTHRAASALYLMPVEFLIVFFASLQFFALDLKRQWWWAGICAIAYLALKSALIWLYARAVIWVVLTNLG